MDEVRHSGAEGGHNEDIQAPVTAGSIGSGALDVTGNAGSGPELMTIDDLQIERQAEVVAVGDNCTQPGLELIDTSSLTSAPADAGSVGSGRKTRKTKQSSASAEEARQIEADRADFACLKTHGEEFHQHDGRSVAARNRLICAAAATAADPTFDPERYYKANGLRFTKRTLDSPLLGLIRMGLPVSHRKLASKWAEGGAEALRTVDDVTALAAALEENGIEEFVRLARARKKDQRSADGQADQAPQASPRLILLGAPETLSGRVTVTLDLHDGFADFINVIEDPTGEGPLPRREGVGGQTALGGA